MMFNLFGCEKNKENKVHKKYPQYDIATYADAQMKTMLVDYYERTVGTPVKMPYREIVLYTYSDVDALLVKYDQGGMEDETVASYLIPLKGAQEIFSAVQRSGMDTWNEKEGIAICGRAYVCKFPDGKGGYMRVTSDNMPVDGAKAFGSVKTAMEKWCREEYRKNE